MATITVNLPEKEFRIINGPSEKNIIFSVFGDIDGAGRPHLHFIVLDTEGVSYKIFAHVSLAYQDIANRIHREKEGVCYYLAGYVSGMLPNFLEQQMEFVAIYDMPSRTGRWIPIPRQSDLFVLPGLYVLGGLNREGKEQGGAYGNLDHRSALQFSKSTQRKIRVTYTHGAVNGWVIKLDDNLVELEEGDSHYKIQLSDISMIVPL